VLFAEDRETIRCPQNKKTEKKREHAEQSPVTERAPRPAWSAPVTVYALDDGRADASAVMNGQLLGDDRDGN